MKKFTLYIIAVVLLAVSGCKPPETTHIAKIENAVMGKIYHPRHGEGELFTIDSPLPEGFDRMALEVRPFDHQLFRIVLEIEVCPGNEDVLTSSRELVCKNFSIAKDKFILSNNVFTAELPGTILILRRAFHLGPRAVSLDIIDRRYAEGVEQLKKSERFSISRQRQKIKDDLRLIAQAIDGYKLDTDQLPEALADLQNNRNNLSAWNGPYCEPLSSDVSYRKISDTKYELFANFNGEKITEDSEL